MTPPSSCSPATPSSCCAVASSALPLLLLPELAAVRSGTGMVVEAADGGFSL